MPKIIRKAILRLAWMIAAVSCLTAAAAENTAQIDGGQSDQQYLPTAIAVAHRAGSFEASRRRPEKLLLSIDFENERLEPLTGHEDRFAKLVAATQGASTRPLGIMYESGSDRDRQARIVEDPQNPDDRVMLFWIKQARAGNKQQGRAKGRIQLTLGGIELDSVFLRYRLYLHPDLDFYRRYPRANGWFTINELWMGPQWEKHPFPFKLGVNIFKPAGRNKPLYFIASADIAPSGVARPMWEGVWAEIGSSFEVPLGEWLDVEIGYKMGDRQNGRFYMAVKRAGDDEFTTVFDITNWTYHPRSPTPVPMTVWQPLKLYTSGSIIDFVRGQGGVVQMYYDDLEVYTDW